MVRTRSGLPYATERGCCPVCPISLSVCNIGVFWPNGWMDQDATWYESRPRPNPRPWPHCVRWGPSSPHRKGHSNLPLFGPWPNGWMDQDTTWYGGRPQPRRHCVRWGPSSPPTERGTAAPSRLVDTWVAHLSNAYLLLVFIVVHLFGVVTDWAQGDTLALLDSHSAMLPFSLCYPLPD